jgi:SAM-dependent methyltransferase
MIQQEFSFTRYLSSKKSVDDRSLNKNVWNRLLAEIQGPYAGKRVNVLELGAGIGTMIERVMEWGLFGAANYLAIDSQPENIEVAGRRLQKWGQTNGSRVADASGKLMVHNPGADMEISLKTADAIEFMDIEENRSRFDLLIANAFLDLIDIQHSLPKLLALLKPGGLFYFTINFDGASIFEPEIDRELDSKIERLYHQTMDTRIINGKLSGDSRTGRHFFKQARAAGARILEAGSSDWVVFPGPDGYCEDEEYFLSFIVDTFRLALTDNPELSREDLGQWLRKRHSQVSDKELVYIAHQVDFLGCRC